MAATADTANYFSVALADDQAVASGSTTPQPSAAPESKEDRAARKAKRIAEAVERSKRDYTAENVYTERGWFLQHDDRGVSKSKIDQQRLEFLVTSLYFSPYPDHRAILDKTLAAFEADSRPGQFPRELLDIGIRSALAAGDHDAATRLARAGRPSWRSQWAGPACSAYDAFAAAEQNDEALLPLISCISIGGPQYPLLTRLRDWLRQPELFGRSDEQTELLLAKVEDIILKREAAATRPIFDDGEEEDAAGGSSSGKPSVKCPDRPALDPHHLARALGIAETDVATLEAAVKKLEKATRSAEESSTAAREDRGVREL